MTSERTTRMLVLGGYLGAGKTTLAINLARYLKNEKGKSVAVIMNDQGDVLVDTEYSREAGLDTREVMGGCFCTNFDKFVTGAKDLVASGRPDVIIAEPIGTSTNIMSSVVAPMRSMYPDDFSVAPFTVVVDCVRALKILSDDKERDEDTVDVVPRNQIKDAETVVLTKTDLVTPAVVSMVRSAVSSLVPGIPIVETSAVDRHNIDQVADIVLSGKNSSKAPLGEQNRGFAFEKAKLGWYSGTFDAEPVGDVDMYAMETDLLKGVAAEYDSDALVHVKVLMECPEAASKMSLVEKQMRVDGLFGSRYMKSKGRLVLNARIVSPPKRLEETMHRLIDEIQKKYPVKLIKTGEKCFMPKPESPAHFFFE
jgi:G3E family GTPase